MLESLILRWGYLAVGVGTFVEGEAVLVVAGALAHRGLLSLPWVMGAAFVGSVASDQFWYHLGRRFGRSFLDRHPRWKSDAQRASGRLDRHGTLFVLGFRFVYGIRTATPLFLGAHDYPATRFVPLNVAGGALWAITFGSVGWAMGASLATALKRTARVEELLAIGLVIAVVLFCVKAVRGR